MMRTLMLFASLLILTAVPAPAAQPTGPAAVVNSFYRWYFSAYATKGGWREHLPAARPYLDPALYALFGKMLASEKRAGGVVLDFDPFANAQEPATSFTVGTPVSGSSTARVPVVLRFGKTAQRTTVTVIVRKNGSWQIDNFDYGSNGNLTAIIEKGLK